jgi:hypothetical protein
MLRQRDAQLSMPSDGLERRHGHLCCANPERHQSMLRLVPVDVALQVQHGGIVPMQYVFDPASGTN